MHIRTASLNDLPGIVHLGKELMSQHQDIDCEYYKLENNFGDLFGNWVKDMVQNPMQLFIVAVDDQTRTVIGFISGYVKNLYPWFCIKKVGHISFLIVSLRFRKKGIGKALEKAANDWFKQKNVEFVELYVDNLNTTGKLVWQKFSFSAFKHFLRKKI